MTFLYAVSGKFDLIISFLLFKKFSHAIALLYSKRTEKSFFSFYHRLYQILAGNRFVSRY